MSHKDRADVARVSTSVPPPGYSPLMAETPVPPQARRRPARLLAGAVSLAIVAGLAYVHIGSTSNQLGGPIAQAATVSSSTAGYRMRMSLEMTSSALSSPITASGSGIVDLRDHASAMTLAMNLGGEPQVIQAVGSGTIAMKMIVDGASVYVKLPAALTAQLPTGGRQWIKVDLAKLAGVPGLSSVMDNPTTSDPSQILKELQSGSDSVVDEGGQRLDGVQTTHYQAEVSLNHLADMLPSADQGAARQALSALGQAVQNGDFPVDVWIDRDHLVRRITMTLDLSLPGGQTMNETAVIDMGDYGPQPPPALPPSGDMQDLSGSLASAAGS